MIEKENFEHTGPAGDQRQSTPFWFLVLCFGVAAWAAYYVFKFWGGLGPGLGY